MEQRGTHCLQEQFVTGYFFIYVRANAVRLYSGSRINRRPVLDAKPAQITRGLRDISCSRKQKATGYFYLAVFIAFFFPFLGKYFLLQMQRKGGILLSIHCKMWYNIRYYTR